VLTSLMTRPDNQHHDEHFLIGVNARWPTSRAADSKIPRADARTVAVAAGRAICAEAEDVDLAGNPGFR
jgi:hypothetical protein